jgi:uridylate kinase
LPREAMRLFRAPSQPPIVVSVGGSLIVPDGISTDFLSSFRRYVLEHIARGFSFYIVAGGGHTAREYQLAAKDVRGDLAPEDMDWLGIHATRLNAHLLRTLFKEEAQEKIVKNPTRSIRMNRPVTIGAGWRPGWSTDYCAVMAGKRLGARTLVNLSDIDYVYDQDPDTNPDATPFPELSWKDFRTLIPDHWDPGLSSPFDPVAAKAAQGFGMEVAIINGKKLPEFDKYLQGQDFIGTRIR